MSRWQIHAPNRGCGPLAVLMTLTVLAVGMRSAVAAERFWINPQGGMYHDPANWDGGGIPNSSSTAVFNLFSLYAVGFGQDAALFALRVVNDKVIFDMDGWTLGAIGGSPPQITVGSEPDSGFSGRLSVLQGVLISVEASIAPQPGSIGAVEIAGQGAEWLLPGAFGRLFVGDFGDGTLEILGDASVSVGQLARIGVEAGARGLLIVDGQGSTFTINQGGNIFMIGHKGHGELFIFHGGKVFTGNQIVNIARSIGSSGSVVVRGAGSLWETESLAVGVRGPGSLLVEDGGQVVSTDDVITLAVHPEGAGEMSVRGLGSSVSVNEQLRLLGNGGIYIDGGGQVIVGGSTLVVPREGATGVLNVVGPKSMLQSGGAVTVGGKGESSLLVADGATLEVNSAQVSGRADAIITGDKSSLLSGDIGVGGASDEASLLIEQGATVECRDLDIGGSGPNNLGLVQIRDPDSGLHINRTLRIGVLGQPEAPGTGVLTIESGITVNCLKYAFVGAQANGPGQLNLLGAGTRLIVVLDFAAGGQAPAEINLLDGGGLSVLGNYAQSSSTTLAIELVSSAVTQGLEHIDINGLAQLAGTLNVTLQGEFDPPVDTAFDIITAASIKGVFDDVMLPTTPSGLGFELVYLPDRVRLVVVGLSLPGDLDGDGTVGVKDLLILLGNWGPCADCTDCVADLDGDCIVGVKDLLILLGNWG
ncbi:MAG: hypothetical protein IIB53_00830 [Planctomycetes bacterium]|nr:hypothetical protein [Planctomycetota bacterium]